MTVFIKFPLLSERPPPLACVKNTLSVRRFSEKKRQNLFFWYQSRDCSGADLKPWGDSPKQFGQFKSFS